jgi:hypothetical protein
MRVQYEAILRMLVSATRFSGNHRSKRDATMRTFYN